MMRRLLLLTALNLAVVAPLQAEQGATVLRDTELRNEPYSDAEVLRDLKTNSQLTVIQRKGGWYQAGTSDHLRGWVRMSTIRLGELRAGSSGVNETLRFLSSGRSGASGVTVATGIRGLDASDMSNATPDHEAVTRLNHYQASAPETRSFAAQAQLKSQPLPYMEQEESNTIPGLGEAW